MLSYGAAKNMAKVYAYNRTLWEQECESHIAAKIIACMTCRLLEAGDISAVIQVAKWNLAHPRKGAINISLGPEYYLDVESRTILDMDGQIIRGVE